jgi:choline dehydrogenase-like flavoprotein
MSDNQHRVIVVGSGPAGAMAALKLVQCGVPVIMLESGETPPGGILLRVMDKTLFRRVPEVPKYDHYVPGDDPSAVWVKSLEPGGLSNYWTGAIPRFAPEDFVEGERLHERYRWPIGYDDLARHYDYAEEVLGVVAGELSVPAVPAPSPGRRFRKVPDDWKQLGGFAEKQGQAIIPTPTAGADAWMLKRSGTGAAFDSFSGIVQRLLRSPLFELKLNAHALKLEWSGQKKKLTGAVYFDRRERVEKRVEAAAVVLGAGSLASTKLLFDSACADFPQGIGNERGVLGKFMHDHTMVSYEVHFEKPITATSHSMYLTRNAYEGSVPLMAAGATMFTSRSKRESINALLGGTTQCMGGGIFGSVIPSEQSNVRPHGTEKDEFGLPKLLMNFRYTEQEKRNVVQAFHALVQVLDAAGHRCRTAPGDPEVWPPGSSVHLGGTVRMHESPQHGVLDRWNRAYAVPNLIVVDASCFTTSSEKNPTLTAMALSARAAEQLAADLKRAS